MRGLFRPDGKFRQDIRGLAMPHVAGNTAQRSGIFVARRFGEAQIGASVRRPGVPAADLPGVCR